MQRQEPWKLLWRENDEYHEPVQVFEVLVGTLVRSYAGLSALPHHLADLGFRPRAAPRKHDIRGRFRGGEGEKGRGGVGGEEDEMNALRRRFASDRVADTLVILDYICHCRSCVRCLAPCLHLISLFLFRHV